MTTTLTPFEASRYFRDHAPGAARSGMRGYVLRLLVDMARLRGRDAGMCFPSVSYLAEKVGRSVRHVRRLLAELETLGEIQRIPQRRADGGYSSNLYRLRGLLSWAAKNVRGASDKGSRKTPYGKNPNPARGGQSDSGKAQAAPARAPLPSAPSARAGRAENSLAGVLSDPVASPVKWRALSPAQVEEARSGCDPVQWERLRLSAGLDGVASVDLDAAAAHRWRAGAIMRGVQLVA